MVGNLSNMEISPNIYLHDDEITLTAVKSHGPGGQNINKLSTAIHLRFDINNSSLPNYIKYKLLNNNDHRITASGIIIIKANSFRTQKQNKEDALRRFKEIILKSLIVPKKRKKTKPKRGAIEKRLNKKRVNSEKKIRRQKIRSLD